MVNRSVDRADWDEELLALELQEIQESDFDLSLTGFDPGEIGNLLALDDEERANATPPLPESPMSRPGDLRLLGPQRVLCGDATNSETVSGSWVSTSPRRWSQAGSEARIARGYSVLGRPFYLIDHERLN